MYEHSFISHVIQNNSPENSFAVVPGVGCYVYAKTPTNDDLYGKAVVVERNLKKITVKYLSGKKQTYNIRRFDAVVWNIEPNPTDLRVGTLIIASDEEHGREQSMSRGRLREIKTNAVTEVIISGFMGECMGVIFETKSFKGKLVHFIRIMGIHFLAFLGIMCVPFRIFCGFMHGAFGF